jgi:hypothetical protein
MSVSGKSDKTQIRCNYSSLLFPACSIYMSAGILRFRYVTAVNFLAKTHSCHVPFTHLLRTQREQT